MFAQLLPWLITAALVGLVLGLAAGMWLGSTITRGHYTHALSTQAYARPQGMQPAPKRGVIDSV